MLVNFTDQSTGGGVVTSWSWTFGDGGVSSAQNPSHTYNDTGYFDVGLTVTGPGGTDDTTRVNLIHVTEPLVASFTGNPLSGNPPLDVQFVDHSTGEPGEPLTWFWTFGDDSTSTERNPLHTYHQAGNYTVSLTVTGIGGRSDDTTRVNYVTVSEVAPVANFGGTPQSGVVPLSVTFTDSSVGVINSWLWAFGDGGTSTQQNPPPYTYNSYGVYTVSLKVTGPGGTSTRTRPNYITVYDSLRADFTANPTSGPKPLFVQFTDNSTPVGEIDTWHWFFGDTNESFVRNPGHTYQEVGSYDVMLIITGPAGADTLTRTNYISVTYPQPTADFSGSPQSGQAALEVHFTDLSTDSVDTWLWNFGDTATDTIRNPIHTYTTTGQYNVRLDVWGPGGHDFTQKNNYITVNPGPASTIQVYGISDPVTAGSATSPTVEVRDPYNNMVTDYADTVHFSSDDTRAILPLDYVFNPSIDNGKHTFSGEVTLFKSGEHYVEVSEVGNPSLSGRQSDITVQPNVPASLVLTPPDNPADTVNVTVSGSKVFTASVADAYSNIISGQRIDLFLTGSIDGFLSSNDSDPNPTYGNGSSRYGFSDSTGVITVQYTAPPLAGQIDVLDGRVPSYVDSSQVDDVIIRSVASGATKLVFLPTGPIVATANTPFDLTVEAQDDLGNLDPGNGSVVNLSSSHPSSMEFSIDNFLHTISQITLSGGTSSGLKGRDTDAGGLTVYAADQLGYLSQGVKSNITIDPGPAEHLTLNGIPSSVTAGAPQTVTVEVLDQWNNTATSYDSTITFLSSEQDPRALLPDDYTFQPGDAGVHTFTDGVILVTAENGQWVLARDRSAPAINDIIQNITVSPASADSLDISGVPDTLEAGSSTAFTVTVMDSFQNTATDYSRRVHFSTDDTGNGVVIPGDYTFSPTLDRGVHLFNSPGLVLVTADNHMLEVVESGNPSVHGSRGGIEVTHTSVDSIILSGLPANTIAGLSHSLGVEAIDRYSNRVLDYTGVVGFSSTDTSATVPGPYSFQLSDQGFRNFPGGVVFRTAGQQRVSAYDSTANTGGRSQVVNVDHEQPYSITITPPDTPLKIVPVTVNSQQVFTATVRDSFSNVVDGEEVTVFFRDEADGFLSDNPDDPDSTHGTNLWQQGVTNSEGKITVLYSSPSQAGLYDILDARSLTIDDAEVYNVTILSVAAGATKLVILPDVPVESEAGSPFSITVEAQDSDDNIDENDSTLVLLSSSSDSMRFSIDNFQSVIDTIQLVGGRSVGLRAKDVIADSPTITVKDVDPDSGFHLLSDTKTDITISPSDPFGIVQLSFSGRDTLTADGSSVTTVTSGAITDMYGNNVGGGARVTVTEEFGTITSQDIGPEPGIQVETDSIGTITFGYRAGTIAEDDTLRAVSVRGNALGSIILVLQAPPTLTYTNETLNPNTVSPGTVQQFSLVLVNSGEAGVTLHDSSTFNFGTGLIEFTSSMSDSSILAGGGGTDTLLFQPDTIPNNMPEGPYTPSLDLYGTDSNGAPYHRAVAVSDDFRLHVSSLILNSVTAFADTVSHGDSVEVRLEVKNSGGTETSITTAGLIFLPPDGQFDELFTNLPLVVPPNGTRNVVGNVKIGSITPPGTYVIDGFVSGTSQSGVVSDSSANIKDSWTVISAALASYVDGSIEPAAVSASGAYQFQVELVNEGASEVTLSQGSTHLMIGEDGELADVTIPEKKVMPGDSSATTLFFQSGVIPGATAPGGYQATLILDGNTGHGGAFHQEIVLPDSIVVEGPPEINYMLNTLSNQVVSTGYQVEFSMDLVNSGEASLLLTSPETFFSIEGGETNFSLDASRTHLLDPGADTTLVFLPAEVPGSLASGWHRAFVVLSGDYNNVSFVDTLQADSLLVELPATLTVSRMSSPDKAAQGETFAVVAVISNTEGDSVASTDAGGSLLLSADGVIVVNASAHFDSSLPDTVTWSVSVPPDLEPGDYLLTVTVDSIPPDENSGQPAKLANPQGTTFPLSVVERNQLSLERSDIGGVPPQNVFKGQKYVPMLALLLKRVGENDNDIRLDQLDVGVEMRGGIEVVNPGSIVDKVYLASSRSGTEVLAENGESAQGTFTLKLDEGYLVGTDTDSLFFFVDVAQNTGAVTFQLVIGGEEAVEAVDVASETRAGVVDGGDGSPLGTLRGQFTVLNQRDFASSLKNYPNPMGSGDGSTTFSYYLPEDASVTIVIYTLTGELVKRLSFPSGGNGGRGGEINQVKWGGYNGVGRYVNDGVYICLVTARTGNGRILSTRYKLGVMR